MVTARPDSVAAPKVQSSLRWAPNPVLERGLVVVPLDVEGIVTLDFGDGTRRVVGAADIPARHRYAAANAYTVTASQGDAVVATVQVFVRDGLAPAVTLAAGKDNPMFWDATIQDEPAHMISRYEFSWGDGSAPQAVVGGKGTVVSHGYQAGSYDVVVLDMNTGRKYAEKITVIAPAYDPDFTWRRGADDMTVEIELTKVDSTGNDVLVDFGDYTDHTFTAAKVGDKISHTYIAAKVGDKVSHIYTAANRYLVQCIYTDGSTEGSALVVTVPVTS